MRFQLILFVGIVGMTACGQKTDEVSNSMLATDRNEVDLCTKAKNSHPMWNRDGRVLIDIPNSKWAVEHWPERDFAEKRGSALCRISNLDEGGYYTWRTRDGEVMKGCHSIFDRGQAIECKVGALRHQIARN